MRWACVLILLLIPLAAAQTEVMTDGEQDASVTLGSMAVPPEAAQTGPYDLVRLTVEEDPRLFTFALQVRDLALDAGDLGNGEVHVQFQHADRIFRLSWYRFESFQVEYRGELSAYDGATGQWNRLLRGDVQIDAGSNTLRFQAPRDALLDGNGTAPQTGRSLARFEAYSRGSDDPFGSQALVQISDRMPDQGYGTAYAVVNGLAQSGDARLSSRDPVRASNGEKGTFVYHVEASNLGEEEGRFNLGVEDVPEGWEVTLPASTIRLDGNTTRSFPVLVSVPFRHVHGAFEDFVLEMVDLQDSRSIGRLQMGIRYLAIPQPAGHHDTLFIHTRSDAASSSPFGPLTGGGTAAYMNTLEEDELDEDVPVSDPTGGSYVAGGAEWTWDIYLEPGLEMGLDFDRNRTGELEVTIDSQSQLSISGASLRGQLLHVVGETRPDGSVRPASTTALADVLPTSPTTVATGTVLTTTLQPTPDSDLVPYDPDAALVLRLVLQADGPFVGSTPDNAPALRGGQMRLPLNEYRDPVESVLNALAGLHFTHDSAAERQVNPGETVLFNLTLANEGAVDDTFALRVNGTNRDWVRILGDQRIFVPTGRERSVVVAVEPPADAPHGDLVDIVITAASQAEPTIQGNVRVLAVVDDAVDHPDESHLVQDVDRSLREGKRTPVPFVLLPLGAALLARRRR